MKPSLVIAAALALSACASVDRVDRPWDGGGAPSAFQSWAQQVPTYRVFPGDQLAVRVPSAPELSQSVTVAPDGAVSFPLAGRVDAMDLTLSEFESRLSQALASQLLRPRVQALPETFGSQSILVIGEVGQPGIYELPGPIGALEAVAIAGGFETSANRRQVGIIRRAANGGAMLRTADLQALLSGRNSDDNIPLQRFDIVYVPRSTIAEANLFVQQYIRDILPVNVGFSYAAGDVFQ